jgi:hypothetical protein
MAEANDEQWLLAWFCDGYFTTAPALSARVFAGARRLEYRLQSGAY